MHIPKIKSIETVVMKNQFGSLYAQDIATMDDRSKWEIPCVGNGLLWKQIAKSIPELQVEFERMFQLLHNAAVIRNDETKENKAKEGKRSARGGTRSTRRE